MSIKIGHASIDENGKAYGGKAGDQTGKEVKISNWYKGNWNFVLRCKDSAKAEIMARQCENGCRNEKIGYDQYQRNSLLFQAKACNWDLSKITVACECDCSSFMTVCAQCAGINVPYVKGNAPVTSTMKEKFTSTGMFDVLTDKEYLNSDAYLKRGDILVKAAGHTVMALENGAKVDGNHIKDFQVWLNAVYKSGLELDGRFGPASKKAAVKAFQTYLNTEYGCKLAVDGSFGPASQAASAKCILRKGNVGNAVTILQGMLYVNGLDCNGMDGHFGPGCEAAVREYQRRKGLDVDGIVGPATYKKLFG